MRLALHFAAWWIFFCGINLALAKWQNTNWCNLPDWAGPGIFPEYNCETDGSKPGTITVRPLVR